MFRLISNIFLVLLSFQINAQVTLTNSNYDFGTMTRASKNWVDIEIKNVSNQSFFIFRVDAPENVDIKFSKKEVKSQTQEKIRVSYTPRTVGSFKMTLLVYGSSWKEPREILIKGESTFSENGLIPCPGFVSSTDKPARLALSVINPRKAPIRNSEIKVYHQGRLIKSGVTDKNGELEIEVPYGLYLISISKNDVSRDTTLFVNAINDYLLMELESFEDLMPSDENLEKAQIVSAEIQKLDTVKQAEKVQDELVYPELPLSIYKPNNLVFLVDVSTSMKKNGKMELLKIAMIELLDLLRPVDRFALISYSSETKILIESQGNLNKSACVEAIQALNPSGNTAGAKAINKSLQVSLNQYILDGNNEIILATDGAFNDGNEKAIKEVKKIKKQDIKLSVLGIKCGAFTTKQMTELAVLGEGEFIPFEYATEAGDQLIDQIKKSSLIK